MKRTDMIKSHGTEKLKDEYILELEAELADTLEKFIHLQLECAVMEFEKIVQSLDRQQKHPKPVLVDFKKTPVELDK